jgi:hypothetical protein
MKRALGLISLVLALGVIYFLYLKQIEPRKGEEAPARQIDLTGIKRDLLAIAQAEKLFMATNNSYGSLEQLRQSGELTVFDPDRRGYRFEVEFEGAARFKVTASPAAPEKKGWPTLSIDETMEMVQE